LILGFCSTFDGDLDRNGVIDGGDLGIMLANWTSVS
jgi:hypothetical protein